MNPVVTEPADDRPADDELVRLLGGEVEVSHDPEILRAYGRDWLTDFTPAPSAVAFPETTDAVARLVTACRRLGRKLVPSGGRTGLSGGATAASGEVVLSLARMNKVLRLDVPGRTVRAEAGVVTQALQEKAAEAGLYLPIDFASKGSSTVGGNVATNAGGIRVVRWGSTRDWVLGLTVVTGRGDVLALGDRLVKDQSGYDLRGLFVGSEGTLGVVTEVTFRLTTPPGDVTRVLCGIPGPRAASPVFRAFRDRFPVINAFEYFSREALEEVTARHGLKEPLASPHGAYVVVELEPGLAGGLDRTEARLFEILEEGEVEDAVMSRTGKEADELLAYRELISESLSARHTLHKNDVSVPVAEAGAFLEAVGPCLEGAYPGHRTIVFGHLGDGNLHVNVLKPAGVDDRTFFETCAGADHRLFELVASFGGSVSAEHGVGLLKRDYVRYTRSEADVSYLRAVKAVFDPDGVLNPGKMIPEG